MIDPALLTDAALEAAASRGLLRRAQKDRDAGLVTAMAPAGPGMALTVDGETVRIGPGGPMGARCTCPATGTCRHILAGLLALRDAAPAAAAAPPAPDVTDEVMALSPAALGKAFGHPALRNAEVILADAVATGGITVEGGTVRIAGQPPVHYVAGAGPGGMVSKGAGDAAATRALHAAALLALRRHAAGEAMAAPAAAAPARREDPVFLPAVDAALCEAARSALSSAPVSVEERLLDLAVSVRADAVPNLAGALRAVADAVAARRNRASSFDPADTLATIARAYALSAALRTDAADPALRGEREEYAPPADLALVGCGVRVWRSATGARGVTAHFVAPDAAGGPRWLSTTLARAAGQDGAFRPEEAARHEAVWGGHVLHDLGRRAFRLHDARVATHRLAPTGRAVPDAAPWAQAVAAHPGLLVGTWSVLGPQLAEALRPGLRRRSGTVCPVLLVPRATGPVQFDELAQTAWWPVQDADGAWLGLALEPGLVDAQLEALDALVAAPPPVVSVLARVDGTALVLSPLALGRDGALEHLDLPPHRPAVPAGTVMERIGRLVSARLGARHGPPPRFVPLPRPPTATAALLAAVADDVLALAELGGRMDDAVRLDRLRGAAGRLDRAGLRGLGVSLARLAGAPDTERPHHLLVFSHTLACFHGLSPALPWVVPA